jgi:hypothetical protein
MAKGQKRSSSEPKKPKAEKPKPAVPKGKPSGVAGTKNNGWE